ncbi:hypothetical protein D3C76_00480 [compost metagenome]
MVRGKSGYNPRQNNNNIGKKVESEEVKQELEVKPPQVEEVQPEIIEKVEVTEKKIETKIIEETSESSKEFLNEQILLPKETFEFPEIEVKSQDEQWIDHVINNELKLTTPLEEKKQKKSSKNKEIEKVEVEVEVSENKEESKIPHYEFKRNDKTRKVERVPAVLKKELKEEFTQVDESSTDIEKQIAKLEQEISSMKNSLAVETDDVKVFSIQKRLQIFQDNLKNLKQE